jgi:lipoyl(octanoyl) transferase
MVKRIARLDLGMMDYNKAYKIQQLIFKLCDQKEIIDTIIFQENTPTITIGRTGSTNHLLLSQEELQQKGIDLVLTDRGGDITYHGPGQLIISMIIHVKDYTKTVHDYLRKLEEAAILLLSNYGIRAHTVTGKSGVWVNHQKIASIGIAVEHAITRHGIAINVNPDLTNFNTIIPCGLTDVSMTSIKELSNQPIIMNDVKDHFINAFEQVFECTCIPAFLEKERLIYEN